MDNTDKLHPTDVRYREKRDSFKYQDGKQVPINNNGVQNIQIGTRQSPTAGFDNTDKYHSFDVRHKESHESLEKKKEKRRQYRTTATNVRGRQRQTLGLVGKKQSFLKKSFLRSRAIAVGVTAFSWVFWVWLVQLFFAVLLLVSLGASAAIEESWWLNPLSDAAKAFLALFGLDFISMTSLMFISWAMIIALGGVTLLGIGMQYKMSFLKPLGGKKSEIKYSFLLLAVIGYCIPGLNLFPWVFLWIMILIIYPK